MMVVYIHLVVSSGQQSFDCMQLLYLVLSSYYNIISTDKPRVFYFWN